MHSLLGKDISLEASEREALFELMEGFEKRVIAFRDTYNDLCERRDNALRYVRNNAKDARDHFEQNARDERQTLENKRNLAVNQQRERIQEAQTEQRNLDRRDEDALAVWNRAENDRLNRLDGENRTKDQQASEKVMEFARCTHRICSISKSICERYTRSLSGKRGKTCTSAQEAEGRLDEKSLRKLEVVRTELQRLNGSLVLRMVRSGKIGDLCASAASIYSDAQEAQRYLAAERQNQSKSRLSQHLAEKKRRSEATDINIRKRGRETDQKVQAYNNRIRAIEQDYQKAIAELSVRQQKDRDNLEATQRKEDSGEVAKWTANCQKEIQKFCEDMNAEFPVDRMQALMKRAWEGQQDFKSLQKEEACRNVLVGAAFVDLQRRGWYSGESGPIVQKILMQRYPGIFYRRNENGKTVVQWNTLLLPYKLSIEKGENLLLYCLDKQAEHVQSIAQAVAMRMLWSIPAGQCQLLLADIAAIGSFASLSALDPAAGNRSGTETVKSILNGENVCSTAEAAQQRILDNTNSYNLNAGQLATYQSLRSYNLKNPMSQSSFLISVFQHFPRGMSETALQSLRKMSTDCGKWGYSSIIVSTDADSAQVDSKLHPVLRDLYSRFICMTAGQQNFFQISRGRSALETGSMVWLYPQPDAELLNEMKSKLRKEMMSVSSRSIVFEDAKGVYPDPQQMFTGSASKGIVVPIGYWQGGEPFSVIFNDRRVHTIITGNTGMGKTNLLHALITNTMLYYPPEEVEMYLIDFKHGNEFERYTTSRFNLPNFKALCLCNEPEFALKMLKKLQLEQMRRVQLFRDAGAVSDLQAYSKKTGRRLPRIIVIIDEIYELEQEAKAAKNQRIRTEILSIIGEFAHQYRAYGIHMVISGQDLTEIAEMGPISGQCGIRIGLPSNDEQLEALVHKDAPNLMRTISSQDKGACVVRPGEQEQPRIAHIVHMKPQDSDEMHFRILQKIHEHYMSIGQYTQASVMLTDASGDASNMYQRFLAFGGDLSTVQSNRFLLGECLSEAEPNELDLTDKNLWIAGGESGHAESAGRSACCFALLSMLLQKQQAESRKTGPQQLQIFFFNGCSDSENLVGGENDRAGEVGLALSPRVVNYVTGSHFRDILETICREVRGRVQSGVGKNAPKIWLLVQRPEEARDMSITVMQMLLEILQKGPDVGIQTVIWTKNVQAVAKMNLGTLRGTEICALEMDSSLYQQVLGSKPNAEPQNWHMHRKNGAQIRVFDLPEKNWIASLVRQFRGGK